MKKQYFLVSSRIASTKFTAFVSFGFEHEKVYRCPVCGMNRIRGIFRERTEPVKRSQMKWPDIMFSIGLDSIVVSNRVVEDMRGAGIAGWREHPLHLEGLEEKLAVAPAYSTIEPVEYVQTHPILLPVHEGLACKFCGMWDQHSLNFRNLRSPDAVLDDVGESVADWVLVYHNDSARVLCSDSVIDLAGKRGWTNFSFRPFGQATIWPAVIRYDRPDWRDLLEKDCEMLLAKARSDGKENTEAN